MAAECAKACRDRTGDSAEVESQMLRFRCLDAVALMMARDISVYGGCEKKMSMGRMAVLYGKRTTGVTECISGSRQPGCGFKERLS